MKYCKKPVVVEAITFEEFVQYGIEHGGNIVNGMPWSFEYKGHPVTHENDRCYIIPTLEGDHFFTPEDMLITGVKGEIYPCKIDIFRATYDPVEKESMSFGRAIEEMKAGRKVARAGWNGKNQHIELATRISYMTAEGVFVNVEHEAIGNKAIAFCGTSGVQMGWLASQADMLAEDWMVVG